MKTSTMTYTIENFSPILLKYQNHFPDIAPDLLKRPLFLDIETTGLSKENAIITIIGLAFYREDQLVLRQWFNDDAISEEAMLREFLDFIEAYPGVFVSYNGNHFDLPFLRSHLSYNELSSDPLKDYPSIDLYSILKPFGKLFSLKDQKQKSWEEFLGISRQDTLSGKELVKVYKTYLKEKEEKDAEMILDHNRDDLHSLPFLLPLLHNLQLKDASFSIYSAEESPLMQGIDFTLHFPEAFLHPLKLSLPQGQLEILDSPMVKLTLPYLEDKIYHFYPDSKNYYYLPAEDRAVHKSIGRFVDPAHRQKANPENCYNSRRSIFLPQVKKGKGHGFSIDGNELTNYPLYKKDYESTSFYVDFDDLFPSGAADSRTIHYLSNKIKSILLESIRSDHCSN